MAIPGVYRVTMLIHTSEDVKFLEDAITVALISSKKIPTLGVLIEDMTYCSGAEQIPDVFK